jgi:hypothetical protein
LVNHFYFDIQMNIDWRTFWQEMRNTVVVIQILTIFDWTIRLWWSNTIKASSKIIFDWTAKSELSNADFASSKIIFITVFDYPMLASPAQKLLDSLRFFLHKATTFDWQNQPKTIFNKTKKSELE